MRVGVPRESVPGERRVALVPEVVARLAPGGFEVVVERGAGEAASFPDAAYEEAGASMGSDVYDADAVVKVQAPTAEEAGRLHERQILIGFLQPLTDREGIERLAGRGVTAFAMESIPRITRAQAMDALSSQATVAGYKAALLAADRLPKFFPMLMTAAGTVAPAKALVLGAGVAGLQAIATARRLGAVVTGFDVRPVVREQIESLGARFVDLAGVAAGGEDASGYATGADEAELARQREALAAEIAASDVVVTTALVPGQRSPVLVTAAAIAAMKPGSVIVDLAAERGGNCEGTVAGKTVDIGGVILVGAENLPATLPQDASQMLGRNLANFVLHIAGDGNIDLDTDDPIVQGTLVARGGRVVHDRVAALLEGPAGETVSEPAS